MSSVGLRERRAGERLSVAPVRALRFSSGLELRRALCSVLGPPILSHLVYSPDSPVTLALALALNLTVAPSLAPSLTLTCLLLAEIDVRVSS